MVVPPDAWGTVRNCIAIKTFPWIDFLLPRNTKNGLLARRFISQNGRAFFHRRKLFGVVSQQQTGSETSALYGAPDGIREILAKPRQFSHARTMDGRTPSSQPPNSKRTSF